MIYQSRLRCIGGNSDGVSISSEYDDRVGDRKKVPIRYEVKMDWASKEGVSETIEQSYNIYRIAKFSFRKDDSYYFLVPEGWTDKEAVLFQFSK
jgi:hypothetical protein